MCCLKIDTETLLANCLNTCKTYSFSPDDLQQILTHSHPSRSGLSRRRGCNEISGHVRLR